MPTGQRAQAQLAKLSTEDQAFIAEWQKKQPIKVVLPDVVGVETANIKAEVVSEDPVGEKYIYRTQHFEFESQGSSIQSLLREVARNFEATYELVKALPWGIDPKPAPRFGRSLQGAPAQRQGRILWRGRTSEQRRRLHVPNGDIPCPF
jgi:hypothetical protein